MESSETPTAPITQYKKEIYKREAERIISRIEQIRQNTLAGISASIPTNHVGHAKDSRVWGMTLKGNYEPARKEANLFKQLLVAEMNIQDDYGTLGFPLTECSSEELVENESRIDAAITAIKKMAESLQ